MRIKKSTRRKIAIGSLIGVVVCVGVGAGFFVTFDSAKRDLNSKIDERDAYISDLLDAAKDLVDSNMRTVYVVSGGALAAGDVLTESNTVALEVFSDLSQEFYADEGGLGKALLVDAPEGSRVTNAMLTDFGRELEGSRELLCGEFEITPNMGINDYADVRIVYPNGETYVVLSKKRLVSADIEYAEETQGEVVVRTVKAMSNGRIWMDPEEIDLYMSAMVDAYIFKGKLILARYIEPTIQEKSIVSYTPSEQSIELINGDPNIKAIASGYLAVEARKALVERLYKTLDDGGKFMFDKPDDEAEDGGEEVIDPDTVLDTDAGLGGGVISDDPGPEDPNYNPEYDTSAAAGGN